MNLHENTELFKDAVLAASQRFGVPEIYVEKDYWITLVLHRIFHSDIADQIIFKGGTCLSKCLQRIRRFSEDIDLVVLRTEDDPYTALSNKIRHIYDLHLMLSNGSVVSFFESNGFSNMLQKVGKDDFISYKNDNEWLKVPPCKAMIFEEPERTWDRIRNTHRTVFKDLVIGDLPDNKELIATLWKIGKRMESIDWRI